MSDRDPKETVPAPAAGVRPRLPPKIAPHRSAAPAGAIVSPDRLERWGRGRSDTFFSDYHP